MCRGRILLLNYFNPALPCNLANHIVVILVTNNLRLACLVAYRSYNELLAKPTDT